MHCARFASHSRLGGCSKFKPAYIPRFRKSFVRGHLGICSLHFHLEKLFFTRLRPSIPVCPFSSFFGRPSTLASSLSSVESLFRRLFIAGSLYRWYSIFQYARVALFARYNFFPRRCFSFRNCSSDGLTAVSLFFFTCSLCYLCAAVLSSLTFPPLLPAKFFPSPRYSWTPFSASSMQLSYVSLLLVFLIYGIPRGGSGAALIEFPREFSRT